MTTTDEITTALGELFLEAPPALYERVLGQLGLTADSDEYVFVDSPAGELLVAFNARGIVRVSLAAVVRADPGELQRSHLEAFGRGLRPATRPPAGLRGALRSGNGGRLVYDLGRLSEFERDVLSTALEIPCGEIRPYAWIAARIGRPRAVRAVGSALGRNPVPILIPCHRVVRSDGTIGNYGLGPGLKRDLLAHEQVDLAEIEALGRERIRFVGSATTRIYCWPTCHSLRRVRAENRVVFKAAHDAAQAGFRPCRQCRPTALAS